MMDGQEKGLNIARVDLDPYGDGWRKIDLSDEIIAAYSLEPWARQFSMMTAGYRDQLDPADYANPSVPFNVVKLAVLGEAKARVFSAKPGARRPLHVHIGGETRPHTQEFIAVLARVYAAHEMLVHLRAGVATTPVWYSSFAIFHEQFDHGENLTASHSQYFKGGWKAMDGEGKQLLEEEEDIVREVQRIIQSRASIALAPWNSDRILHDLDVDAAYVAYQRSVVGPELLDEVRRAAGTGFRCAVCPQGGSMKATTERLFHALDIPTGETGLIRYLYGEEDTQYHRLGVVKGVDYGADPGKPQIYRNIGAQKILERDEADVVFIWDPDGDRFNMVTKAPATVAPRAVELGLEVESEPDQGACIVYFTPNQIFFMLTAFRLAAMKASGLLSQHDWFVARSVSTTRAIRELAAAAGLTSIETRVGFKYMGTLAAWIEQRSDASEQFVTPSGNAVSVGPDARALMMCEESGGAICGGPALLMNKGGTRGILALREKDGMQLGLLTLGLAASLHNRRSSFAEYYEDLIREFNIYHKHFTRRDVTLYDESLTGAERQAAKDRGIQKRDRVMSFLFGLCQGEPSRCDAEQVKRELNARLAAGSQPFPAPSHVCAIGDGVLVEFSTFWFVVRASGTDAVLRYYIEGGVKAEVEGFLSSLVNLAV